MVPQNEYALAFFKNQNKVKKSRQHNIKTRLYCYYSFVWEEFLAQSKIRKYDVSLRVQENIFQFDVAVDNAQLK